MGKQATLGDGYGCLGGRFSWYHGVALSIRVEYIGLGDCIVVVVCQ